MKRTVLSNVEILPNGVVLLRLEKQIVEGESVLAMEYHRTSFMPGQSVDETMAAVDAHLRQMGHVATDPDAIARVKRIVSVEHTPDVVAKFKKDP